jgi:hypothetical protein
MKRIASVPTRKAAESLRAQLRSRAIKAYVRCVIEHDRTSFVVFTNEEGS